MKYFNNFSLCLILFFNVLVVHGAIDVSGKLKLRGKLTSQENRELQQSCGHYKAPQSKSYGGSRAVRNEAPWVVSLAFEHRYRDSSQTYTKQLCSATLISNRHVLTARHCWEKAYFQKIRAVFDDDCGASVSNASCSIKNAIIRKPVMTMGPVYTGISGYNDLALLELDQPVAVGPNLYPACLSELHPKISDELNLYGYGRDTWSEIADTMSGALQHITMKTVSCRSAPSIDTLCVFDRKQKSYKGDSGGGLTYNKYGRTFVAGLISGTDIHGEDHDLATAHHLSWICKYTGICVNTRSAKQIKARIETFPNF